MPDPFAVVPVLIGPLQILLTILPGLILAAVGALISLLHPRAALNGLKILWRQKLQAAMLLALLLALGAGVVYGAGWLWRTFGPQPATATAAVGGGDWPTAHGSVPRRGAVPGDPAPTRGGINWSFKNDESFLCSPVVVGNRIYVTSAGGISIFDKEGKGRIYCFDADTGAKVWELAPPGYRATFSSPVVPGQRL